MRDPHAEFSVTAIVEENARGVIPTFQITLDDEYRRACRIVRVLDALLVAALVMGFRPLAPAWFAVLIAVLAGVGVFALFEEVMFDTLVTGKAVRLPDRDADDEAHG